MANPINPRPLEPALRELKEKGFSDATVRLFRDTFTRIEKAITNLGQIQSQAPVTGRTEGLGITVSGLANTGDINAATKVVGRTEGLGTTTGNIDGTGKLTSTDAIAADGTGSPLTGGKRGFVALDTNNRLASSFRANAVNVSLAPTSATVLSNPGGATTVITIAASTVQYGAGTVSYNSGSVDPGVIPATVFIYADDPTFAGGAVTYAFSTTPPSQTASDGRINIGKLTTSVGGPTTGGGYSGGTSGSGQGGRGFNQL